MFIEYALNGSKTLHKGAFDTTGFWIKYDFEICDISLEIVTYKIYSLCSFAYEHTDKAKVDSVFDAICAATAGESTSISDVGYVKAYRE